MAKSNPIESNFYFYAKLAGIEQVKPDTFQFAGKTYKAGVQVSTNAAKALGGKPRAFKLIRHARLIQFLAAKPEGDHIAGIVAASFDAISKQYPILRSYYEGTMLGAEHHGWLRWK